MLLTDAPLHSSKIRKAPHGCSLVVFAQKADVEADPLWQLEVGADFPYRSVEVLLKEGSFFRMPAEGVARLSAELIFSAEQCSVAARLRQQIIPAVRECPEFLLELAARLPWQAWQSLAQTARWRTPVATIDPRVSRTARLALSTCSA